MAGYLEFEPIPSEEPGVPDFIVRVPSSVIRGDKMPIPGVTTYGAFPYATKSRNNEAWTKDYVYVAENLTGSSRQPDGSLLWEFYFTKNRGDDLFREPIAFRTENTTKPHSWDDVIMRMGFIEDPTQPLAVQVGTSRVEVSRLFDRFWHLPGGVYATKMKVEVFLNHEAFPEDMFLLNTPVPTTVSWALRNSSGRMKALHPHIRFPETQTGGTVLDGAGTIGNPIVLNQYQDFPATNHPTWIQHVADEDVSQIHGVRRLVRTTVFPPGTRRIRNST